MNCNELTLEKGARFEPLSTKTEWWEVQASSVSGKDKLFGNAINGNVISQAKNMSTILYLLNQVEQDDRKWNSLIDKYKARR